jgi:hypothetical protein
MQRLWFSSLSKDFSACFKRGRGQALTSNRGLSISMVFRTQSNIHGQRWVIALCQSYVRIHLTNVQLCRWQVAASLRFFRNLDTHGKLLCAVKYAQHAASSRSPWLTLVITKNRINHGMIYFFSHRFLTSSSTFWKWNIAQRCLISSSKLKNARIAVKTESIKSYADLKPNVQFIWIHLREMTWC